MNFFDDPPLHIPARRGGELVGPVMWFRGQQMAVTSSPPRSTIDPRYLACVDHHLACDCREAELSEQINEFRSEAYTLRETISIVLAGHATEVYQANGQRRNDLECQCSGCVLVRAAHAVPFTNRRNLGHYAGASPY